MPPLYFDVMDGFLPTSLLKSIKDDFELALVPSNVSEALLLKCAMEYLPRLLDEVEALRDLANSLESSRYELSKSLSFHIWFYHQIALHISRHGFVC